MVGGGACVGTARAELQEPSGGGFSGCRDRHVPDFYGSPEVMGEVAPASRKWSNTWKWLLRKCRYLLGLEETKGRGE